VLLFEVARYLKLAAVGDGLRASGETGCRSASNNRRSAWPTQVFAGRTRSVCVGGKLLGVASRSPEQSGHPRRRALDSFRSDRVAMTESRPRTSAPLRSGTQVSGGSDSRSSSLASTRAWRATCSGSDANPTTGAWPAADRPRCAARRDRGNRRRAAQACGAAAASGRVSEARGRPHRCMPLRGRRVNVDDSGRRATQRPQVEHQATVVAGSVQRDRQRRPQVGEPGDSEVGGLLDGRREALGRAEPWTEA
jgi:hypothetical protein